MELEEIEALSNLSVLSRVDLFNLLGRVEQLNRRLRAERKRRKIDIDNKTPKTKPLNHVRADVGGCRFQDRDQERRLAAQTLITEFLMEFAGLSDVRQCRDVACFVGAFPGTAVLMTI